MKKKVVDKIVDADIISVDDCENNGSYGIVADDECVGYISRHNDKYKLMWATDITNGNLKGSADYSNICLNDLLQELVGDDFEVSRFDTVGELFIWLSEQDIC